MVGVTIGRSMARSPTEPEARPPVVASRPPEVLTDTSSFNALPAPAPPPRAPAPPQEARPQVAQPLVKPAPLVAKLPAPVPDAGPGPEAGVPQPRACAAAGGGPRARGRPCPRRRRPIRTSCARAAPSTTTRSRARAGTKRTSANTASSPIARSRARASTTKTRPTTTRRGGEAPLQRTVTICPLARTQVPSLGSPLVRMMSPAAGWSSFPVSSMPIMRSIALSSVVTR